MRLDYLLAHGAGLTRSEARRSIRQGRVRVNGEVARKSAAQLPDHARVTLDGAPVVLEVEHRYLMLNKPLGVVSATADGLHPTVLDLLPADQRAGLHPVGRLDLDTTGLLLLTTDGQWSHRITSPRSGCAKVYRAWLAEPLGESERQALEQGVQLRGESGPSRAVRAELLDETTLRLTLTEGRYHQVKRMLAAVGNRVRQLHREQIGQVALDPALEPGQWRALTAAELELPWQESRE